MARLPSLHSHWIAVRAESWMRWPSASVADGPASGRVACVAHRRRHGLDGRAQVVALGGVEHRLADEVAVGAERGAVPGGGQGRWHGAEAIRPVRADSRGPGPVA